MAIVIVASLAGVALYLSSLAPPTTPPPVTLDGVTISGGNAADQAGLVTLSASAVDTTGRLQTANATWTWSASPAGAVQIRTTATPSTRQIFAIQAGVVTITANASWEGSAREDTHTITVTALSFELTPSAVAPLVGSPFNVALRVLRPGSALATSYDGTVHFTSSDPAAGLPADYAFSVADGGVKNFLDLSVSQPGSVTITASDTLAAITGSTSMAGNRAPTASFTATPDVQNPLRVTADGTASSDPDGDPFSYDWDFGDGNTATTTVATNTYAQAGSYTILLTVTDNHAASDTATRIFSARARPTASFQIVGMSPSGLDIRATVDAAASSDPDGTITNYNWSWGDGNFTDTAVADATHDYGLAWHDMVVTITLTVTDNDGLSGSASQDVTVTVVPLPPTADFVVEGIEQITRTVTVRSTSTDPNANLDRLNWSWGDGTWDEVSAANPTSSHQYMTDGNFVINLTAIDTTNLRDWKEEIVPIAQPQVAPTAIFTVQRTLMVATVDASASFDPNNDIASYEWDFDEDGQVDATGVTATFDYASAGSPPGAYTIELVVTDQGGRQGSATRIVSIADSTIDYRYHDFFDVEYGEWWDYRFATYGDLPIDAECFNATSIADGVCTATDPNVDDVPSYPYTNWYPLPGQTRPGNPTNNPLVYAPYRFDVTGVNVPGYNLYEPVFLPVFNYGAPVGDSLSFRWYLQYLDFAKADALTQLGCSGVDPRFNDGFYVRSQIWLTLDLEESMHIFGVPVGSTPGQAQTWWNQNTDNACGTEVGVESDISAWFESLGGPAGSTGKYDVVNSFEYQYTPFYTNVTAIVDSGTGTTHAYVEHAAWATEVLLSRMFYWGNASYADNHLDSTQAEGWWGMELAWFEDMTFQGSLGQTSFDFTLDSVMQYHFQQLSLPGPDGNWDRDGDIPYWTWGPILTDYTNDYSPKHLASELDRYPSPAYGYIHSTPGSARYSQNLSYDYAPIKWDLEAGQTWHFEFPAGDVVFYDPVNTPLGTDPTTGGYIEILAPLSYDSAHPAGYGIWDSAALTWDVYGPSVTGGPAGSPGPDATPGTSDDDYALEPWGAIKLVAGSGGGALANPMPVSTASPLAPLSIRDGPVSMRAGSAASSFRAVTATRTRWE